MKKVIVVSKTHLDLGFTDYAENIRQTYINEFIPDAVSLTRQVNTPAHKRFVWTTGAWLLKEALAHGTPEQRTALRQAIVDGDVAPHALPFTTHTELLDEDTLEYGLSIVDELDKLRSRKTVAAKMTDVPGHTRGLVHLLARRGVKLLHIGVNGASAVPEVPPCFLWRCGSDEVVVIYSGDYGGAFSCDLVDEVLYFDHTRDNHGAPSPQKMLAHLQELEKQYPGYTVEAGTMDEFADVIWEKRASLPVVTGEIGDSWIHGAAADPYKSAALRELMALKANWLRDGSLQKGSPEYVGFSDNLLCVAEHTCGMDVKMYFADFENYLKADFARARRADRVHMRHPLRDFPQNVFTLYNRLTGAYRPGSYRVIEQSWAEQRAYIDKALAALSPAHRQEAQSALARLRPAKPEKIRGTADTEKLFRCGDWRFRLNRFGGVGYLACGDTAVVRENDEPAVEYRVYDDRDYDFWLQNYSRNLQENLSWAVADFGRPLLKYVRGKYRAGRFPYRVVQAVCVEETAQRVRLCADLRCDRDLCTAQSAPRQIRLLYTLTPQGLQFDVQWFGKDAGRLSEALFLHLFPAAGRLRMRKLGEWVAPDDVVSMGGRNLHAVQETALETQAGRFRFVNRHAPLLSVGRGKILEYDNRFEDPAKDGITYVLHDNVWGTNFPLWYGENAAFHFEVTAQPENAG